MKDRKFKIKITGSGNEKEIIFSLESVIATLKKDSVKEWMSPKRTYENSTVIAKITKLEE